jgi:hypothetical protein
MEDYSRSTSSTNGQLNNFDKTKSENLRLSNETVEIERVKLDSFEGNNLGISVEINGAPKYPDRSRLVCRKRKKSNVTIISN